MRSFLLAISFLTILPAYSNRAAGEKEMASSLYSYPLVGGVIGALLALLVLAGDALSLGLGGDALVIVVWIVLTGGLHLDGLMDSADGFFSGKDRQRKLEIMKDSRVGAMGVIALAAILLLKVSFLASLPLAPKLWAVFLAPVLGRTAMVYGITFFPYARATPGLGRCFGDGASKGKFYGAGVFLLLLAFLAGQGVGLLVAVASLLAAVGFSHWTAWVLGGQTGDTYGAICEMGETFFMIAAVIGWAVFYG